MKKEIEKAAEAKSGSISDHGWWREVDVVDFAIAQVREQIKRDAEINCAGCASKIPLTGNYHDDGRNRPVICASYGILAQLEEDR